MEELIKRYRESINPPYKPKDYLVLVATFGVLLFFLLLLLRTHQQKYLNAQAQTATPTLSASPTTIQPGGAILISWNNVVAPTPYPWSVSMDSLSPATGQQLRMGQSVDVKWHLSYTGSDSGQQTQELVTINLAEVDANGVQRNI